MKGIFDNLIPIQKSTGLEINVYSLTGSILFSTDNFSPDYEFKYHSIAEFESAGGVIQDIERDITYFIAGNTKDPVVGVITGSNEVSHNYAVMVSHLIDAAALDEQVSLTKSEKLSRYLNGQLKRTQAEQLKSSLFEKKNHYYFLNIKLEKVDKMKELLSFLSAMQEGTDIISVLGDKEVVYIKNCGGEGEYSSANDFANVLYENIIEEIKIRLKINVGGVIHKFDDLSSCYKNSLFAYNYGKLLDPAVHVYSYKDYVMIKMLEDIPKENLSKYLDTLLDSSGLQILKDEELMETANAFMKNSLNISKASDAIYLHRNTFIYRLDKIESETGFNLRHFNDALIFRLAYILYKLVLEQGI